MVKSESEKRSLHFISSAHRYPMSTYLPKDCIIKLKEIPLEIVRVVWSCGSIHSLHSISALVENLFPSRNTKSSSSYKHKPSFNASSFLSPRNAETRHGGNAASGNINPSLYQAVTLIGRSSSSSSFLLFIHTCYYCNSSTVTIKYSFIYSQLQNGRPQVPKLRAELSVRRCQITPKIIFTYPER